MPTRALGAVIPGLAAGPGRGDLRASSSRHVRRHSAGAGQRRADDFTRPRRKHWARARGIKGRAASRHGSASFFRKESLGPGLRRNDERERPAFPQPACSPALPTFPQVTPAQAGVQRLGYADSGKSLARPSAAVAGNPVPRKPRVRCAYPGYVLLPQRGEGAAEHTRSGGSGAFEPPGLPCLKLALSLTPDFATWRPPCCSRTFPALN
jgi:hypothetical protein